MFKTMKIRRFDVNVRGKMPSIFDRIIIEHDDVLMTAVEQLLN